MTHTRRVRRRGSAFASVSTLFIVTMVSIAAMALLSSALFQVRASVRGENRMNALVLAEAGIDDAVAQLQADPSFSGGSGALFEDPPTNSRRTGGFATTVVALDDVKRRVTSVGTTANGSAATVAAVLTIDTRSLGNAAIMANGPINIGGNVNVNSVPNPDLRISHVYANGNIGMGGSSYVDGELAAAGTVSGTAYWPSQSGVPPYPYPNAATTEGWRQQWATQALAGGSRGQVRNNATINAPCFIDGNITLSSSERVTINGPGIVYVNGSVSLTSQSVLTNGATLVVRDTFNQSGQSTYRINAAVTPTPTLVVYGTGSSATSDTVSLTGGSLQEAQGIVYAVNGNIRVAGGSVFVGALVAGGAGSGVVSNGGYTHRFPEGMASVVKFPAAAAVQGIAEL